MPLVAFDQINHIVDADITTLVTSYEGGLGEGQQIQEVNSSCTNLIFNVFSLNIFETLRVFAEGPCSSEHAVPSTK